MRLRTYIKVKKTIARQERRLLADIAEALEAIVNDDRPDAGKYIAQAMLDGDDWRTV